MSDTTCSPFCLRADGAARVDCCDDDDRKQNEYPNEANESIMLRIATEIIIVGWHFYNGVTFPIADLPYGTTHGATRVHVINYSTVLQVLYHNLDRCLGIFWLVRSGSTLQCSILCFR